MSDIRPRVRREPPSTPTTVYTRQAVTNPPTYLPASLSRLDGVSRAEGVPPIAAMEMFPCVASSFLRRGYDIPVPAVPVPVSGVHAKHVAHRRLRRIQLGSSRVMTPIRPQSVGRVRNFLKSHGSGRIGSGRVRSAPVTVTQPEPNRADPT